MVDFNAKKKKSQVQGTHDKSMLHECRIVEIEPTTSKNGREGWILHIVPTSVKKPVKNEQYGTYSLGFKMNLWFNEDETVCYGGEVSNLVMTTSSEKADDLIEALEDVYTKKLTFFMAIQKYWNQKEGRPYYKNPLFKSEIPKDWKPAPMVVTVDWDPKEVVAKNAPQSSYEEDANDESGDDKDDLPF